MCEENMIKSEENVSVSKKLSDAVSAEEMRLFLKNYENYTNFV